MARYRAPPCSSSSSPSAALNTRFTCEARVPGAASGPICGVISYCTGILPVPSAWTMPGLQAVDADAREDVPRRAGDGHLQVQAAHLGAGLVVQHDLRLAVLH